MSSFRSLRVFCLYLFISSINFVSSRQMKLHLKSIKCTHDPTMFNGTVKCSIKPFRNGTQLATSLFTFQKPCDDLWAHVLVFFKFGGQAAYRPWMFNYDENICEIFKGNAQPQLFSRLMFKALNNSTRNLVHKCPYVGEEGFRSVNLEKVLADAIPHVLPTGDYRVLFRFHTTSNKTFLEVLFGGRIDARNPMEAESMG